MLRNLKDDSELKEKDTEMEMIDPRRTLVVNFSVASKKQGWQKLEVLSAPWGKRITMEKECCILADACNVLCFRNTNVGSVEEENAWIADIVADQCTVIRRV